jgi:hypothetical protein
MTEGVPEPDFQIVHSFWGPWIWYPSVSGWRGSQCESPVFRHVGSIGERED